MNTPLFVNMEETVSIILFGIGFTMLMLHRNLIKKILGMNIMDTAVPVSGCEGLYPRTDGANRGGRDSGCVRLYQSGSQRPGSDGNRGLGEYYGADAGTDDPAV